MDLSQYLIKTINSKQQEPKLNYGETMGVLHAISNISEEKILIEKAIELLESFHNIHLNSELLSKREFQVFELIGKGYLSSEIAVALNISKATVSTHRKNIIKKLKLKERTKLQNLVFQHINNK